MVVGVSPESGSKCRGSVSAAIHSEAAARCPRLRPHARRPSSQDRRCPGRLPGQTAQHSQPSARRGRGRTRAPRRTCESLPNHRIGVDEDTGDGGAHVPEAFVDEHRVIEEPVGCYARIVILSVPDGPRVALVTARLGARNPPEGGAGYPPITRWNGLERALQPTVRRAKAPVLYTKRLQIPRHGRIRRESKGS